MALIHNTLGLLVQERLEFVIVGGMAGVEFKALRERIDRKNDG